MKVNWRRTVEKQREAEHQEWLNERQEKLNSMTSEEREQFLFYEKQQAKDALATMALAQSIISDSPYFKI